MSRKEKPVHPEAVVTESFQVFFSATGHSKDGAKSVVKRREVPWKPATTRRKRKKAS